MVKGESNHRAAVKDGNPQEVLRTVPAQVQAHGRLPPFPPHAGGGGASEEAQSWPSNLPASFPIGHPPPPAHFSSPLSFLHFTKLFPLPSFIFSSLLAGGNMHLSSWSPALPAGGFGGHLLSVLTAGCSVMSFLTPGLMPTSCP